MNEQCLSNLYHSFARLLSVGWLEELIYRLSCDLAVNRAIVVSKSFFPDRRNQRSRLKRSIGLLMIVLWYANIALWWNSGKVTRKCV